MPDARTVRFEPKMMIDGKLVDGEVGTFTNINPATEEPLGEVADASKADMHRAIDAARRAFDETDWSTNHKVAPAVPVAIAGGVGVRTRGTP
jgi:aldehyde dehydrogenase (NAD+)